MWCVLSCMKVAVNELVDGANHVVQCSGNVFANELDSDSHSLWAP